MKFKYFILSILTFLTASTYGAEQGFISDPNRPENEIEFFTLNPEGEGPFPIFFLIHGDQPSETSTGGKKLVEQRYLESFTKNGVIAVAISVPGFGSSDGDRDFCGPDSQKAIAAVIEHFSHLPIVDTTRMGIYGINQGATLASNIHAYAPTLSIQILEAGNYDLTKNSLLPDYLKKTHENILIEAGISEKDLKERSGIYNTQYVQAKTLILAGEFDDRRAASSSTALHEKLLSEGKNSQLKIYPNTGCDLSTEKWADIYTLIRNQFFNLYEIGAQISSKSPPAIQVLKIFPNRGADRAGKLRVGDVVLRISPNDDDEEIDAIGMPSSKFIPLILGKKGSYVRLHVQHFDQTYEDIVIERG